VLGQPADREVVDDGKGGRVDHVDGVVLGVGNIDPSREAPHHRAQGTGVVGGVDVSRVQQRRHARKQAWCSQWMRRPRWAGPAGSVWPLASPIQSIPPGQQRWPGSKETCGSEVPIGASFWLTGGLL